MSGPTLRGSDPWAPVGEASWPEELRLPRCGREGSGGPFMVALTLERGRVPLSSCEPGEPRQGQWFANARELKDAGGGL